MQASMTIGGIEVALKTPVRGIEVLIAEGYAPFLGAVESPVCTLVLESNRREVQRTEGTYQSAERFDSTKFRIAQPGILGLIDTTGKGVFDVVPSRMVVDTALAMVFGLIAPDHDALFLRGASIVAADGAHVFLGMEADGAVADGLVLIHRAAKKWRASSTPFSTRQRGLGTWEDTLSRVWVSGSDETNFVADQATVDHAFLGTDDLSVKEKARLIADALSSEVPVAVTRL